MLVKPLIWEIVAMTLLSKCEPELRQAGYGLKRLEGYETETSVE